MAAVRIERIVTENRSSSGRQVGEAKRAYRHAKRATRVDLPFDEDGRARVVCRRYAERRAVVVDASGRPDCFEAGHPDCEGGAEDVREGVVETW